MKQNQGVADFILNKLPEPPHSAVILGSGLGQFTAKLQELIQIPYADIPDYIEASYDYNKYIQLNLHIRLILLLLPRIVKKFFMF